MPTACSICTHPHRDAIEAQLAARVSQRQVAAQFQVGKSTLSRHQQHGGRPAAPATSPVTLPAVSGHQAALQALRDEQRALPEQLAALRQELDRVAFDRNVCRDLQADKRGLPALEAQVSALQGQIAAGEARLATLPQLVVAAQQALTDALSRRQAAMQAHWQWIETQRSPEAWDEWSEGEGEVVQWVFAVQRQAYADRAQVGRRPPEPSAALLQRYGSWQGLHQARDRWRERLLTLYPFPEEVHHG